MIEWKNIIFGKITSYDSFACNPRYDLLPSPTNLQLWKLSEDLSCPLCDNIGSMRHILSSCPTALSQGRYRWRHNQVLGEIAHLLEKERRRDRPQIKERPHFINLVHEEKKAATTKTHRTCLLDESRIREMRVDLKQQLKFPEEVAQTTLRPYLL